MKIHYEKIPSTDPRLGRHIYHDDRSKLYPFDTSGLTIVNVKHTRHIGILDQGQLGSCTGNAGIGSLGTDPLFATLPTNLKYPLNESGAVSLYSDAEKIDGGAGYPPEDNGSHGLSIAKALKNAGLISGYQHTFTLQDALKAGSTYPFITGINWYQNMFNPDADGRVHLAGSLAGGHEIEMNEIDADNGRIWFCNSWGANWGVQGRFYLTWEDYDTLLGQQGDVTVLLPVTSPAPVPITRPVLRKGSTGPWVKILQEDLIKNGYPMTVDSKFGDATRSAVIKFQADHGLTPDGIVATQTWNAFDMIDIITAVATQKGVEPLLMVSVATCESGLNPNAKLYNKPSKSTDRGLYQWNDKYHSEISDAQAYDPKISCGLACDAVLQGKVKNFWSASMACWKKKLTPDLITKYHLV